MGENEFEADVKYVVWRFTVVRFVEWPLFLNLDLIGRGLDLISSEKDLIEAQNDLITKKGVSIA